MVSERRLAERMESYWSELTPHLAAYVRRLNLSGFEQESIALKSTISPSRMFLVSEVAYKALVRRYPAEPTKADIAQHSTVDAIAIIERFIDASDQSAFSADLSDDEIEFATKLASTTRSYLAGMLKGAQIAFAVPVVGHGFVDHLEMDATSGDTLFEFKATERPLSSSDLRQILVYLTLSHFSGREFKWVNIFNSRRGKSYSILVSDLVLHCAGVPLVEFYHRSSDVFQRLLFEEQS